MRLAGQGALVSGAAREIGAAIARLFATGRGIRILRQLAAVLPPSQYEHWGSSVLNWKTAWPLRCMALPQRP